MLPPRPQRHWISRPCPDRKSTRLNSSHLGISYAVFCLKQKQRPDHGVLALLDLECWPDADDAPPVHPSPRSQTSPGVAYGAVGFHDRRCPTTAWHHLFL